MNLTIRSKMPLRICTTLVDAKNYNETTELVEPSGVIEKRRQRRCLPRYPLISGTSLLEGFNGIYPWPSMNST